MDFQTGFPGIILVCCRNGIEKPRGVTASIDKPTLKVKTRTIK